jgi:hypothetical protein
LRFFFFIFLYATNIVIFMAKKTALLSTILLFTFLLPSCVGTNNDNTTTSLQCLPERSNVPEHDYTINGHGQPVGWSADSFPIPVIISPSFDEYEVNAIELSIGYWNRTVGLEVFRPVYGLSNVIQHTIGAISLTEQRLEPNCGYQTLGLATKYWNLDFWGEPTVIRSTHIEIHDELQHSSMYMRTVVHELGHALGLHHDRDSSSVMYPSVFDGSWEIEQVDLDFVINSMRR